MTISVIYTTTDTHESAMLISTTLVKEDLVACVNVSRHTQSIYKWEGALQMEEEITLYLKVATSKVDDVVKRLKEIHHYDVPNITVWEASSGNADFFDWVNEKA